MEKLSVSDRLRGIGARIAAGRRACGLNQGQLADLLGIQQSRLSQWEAGKRAQSAIDLIPFADTYDVSLDFIFRGKEGSLPVDLRNRIREILDAGA